MGAAHAYPEGAPWGAANPDAAENCSTCHFDYDAVRESKALSIEGIPEHPVAGETYSLSITLMNSSAATAGFQVLATAEDGDAGTFSTSADDMEIDGSGIRSTHPSISDFGASWTFDWTAPPQTNTKIMFFIAVMASNDDGSPFGDQAHFLALSIDL
jgi:hypothetical protein